MIVKLEMKKNKYGQLVAYNGRKVVGCVETVPEAKNYGCKYRVIFGGLCSPCKTLEVAVEKIKQFCEGLYFGASAEVV